MGQCESILVFLVFFRTETMNADPFLGLGLSIRDVCGGQHKLLCNSHSALQI